MVELKRALPDYFTAVYEVDAVLNAVSKELDRLYAVIDTAFANLSVTTASGAFERWENDLGLSHFGTDEERRQAILANLGLIKTQTTATILSLIRAFARHSEAVVKENGYVVSVNVTEEGEFTEFRQLIAQIERALPYHLTVDFSAQTRLEAGYMRNKLSLCTMEMELFTSQMQ